ncbi:MAG: hypothetical protein K2N72_06995 [Oscillospiraceae bacterium]|nr:hypothetical protein [Oscillospiraceae bacterium]
MPTDVSLKHILRNFRTLLKEIIKLAKAGKIDELIERAEIEITDITETLGD